ncbi:hypothetical protein [Nocardioides bizhenqiangii]|uniref:GPP34 family phosphoprotein n=1 Tax=Nocardioides bizhenqiangii TaxID=3095076 RepID=A0ABZ0ZTN6_9ACTN|nr:hypothetical protein [Nocardioides sp. HM61]WQQ27276.1 hypothetical protein SHK19_03385 [Nocardioides sp. HM61]
MFDTLFLVSSADPNTGLSVAELQTLDYLGCLMSVYDGEDASAWEFGFSVTDLGAPFSTTLNEAAQQCQRVGWIVRSEKIFQASAAGREEVAFQSRLAPNMRRVRYLSASIAASMSMTLPSISDALNREPGLRRAIAFMRRKRLLDDTSLGLVIEQFDGLREAVGDGSSRSNLMVPTVVWLSYLAADPDRQVGG